MSDEKRDGAPASVAPLWEARLIKKKGRVEDRHANTVLIMENAPEWKGLLQWDSFAEKLLVTRDGVAGPAGVWSEHHGRVSCTWLQRSKWKLKAGIPSVHEAALHAGHENAVHPLRERLRGCLAAWDGVARADLWLSRYLGAEDTPVHREMGLRWLLSAVKRVFEPGCKADATLILEGPQGSKKSTALEILSLGYFRDQLSELGSKDCLSELQGVWVIEMGELDAMRKTEVSRVKAFLTSRVDSFRAAYGRYVKEYPRSCIFAGTTNERTYFHDETGNRRFYTVRCGEIALDLLRQEVEQLLGEVVSRYQRGEASYTVDVGLADAIRLHVSTRVVLDSWHERLQSLLEHRDTTSIDECLSHLDIEVGRWDQRCKNRVARTLHLLEFERYQQREGTLRTWRYRRKEVETGVQVGDSKSSTNTDTSNIVTSVPSIYIDKRPGDIDFKEVYSTPRDASDTGATGDKPPSAAEQVLAALGRMGYDASSSVTIEPDEEQQETASERMARERRERAASYARQAPQEEAFGDWLKGTEPEDDVPF